MVKRRTFLAGIGGVAVAGSAAAYLLTREDARKEKTFKPPLQTENRLFRYVPDTGELTMMPGAYGTSNFLPSIAYGEGAVWTGDVVLHHVDPDDGSEGDPIELHGTRAWLYDITIGFRDVWAVNNYGLHRFDPGGDDLLGFRAIPGSARTVAIGFGSVWVGDARGALFRVEPSRKLPILATLQVGDVLSGVTMTDEAVWVSDEFGALIPIDPSVDHQQEAIAIGGSPKGLAATSDRLWTVDPQAESVTVVDIETRKPIKQIPVGGQPIDVAAGLGAVWVADFEGRIVRIDAAALSAVDNKSVGGPVAALAIDEDNGVIWLRTGGTRLTIL